MFPVLDNLCHWMQNILLANLLYEKHFLTVTEQLHVYYEELTVLKPHQFAKSFCNCLPKRHGQ